MMKPKSLAILKGVMISLIMMVPTLYAINKDTGFILVGVFILAVLLAMGVEIYEIEIGNWFYAKFPVSKNMKVNQKQDTEDNDG
jgi:uncharacterized membrane protein YoaT (DUF817 family)